MVWVMKECEIERVDSLVVLSFQQAWIRKIPCGKLNQPRLFVADQNQDLRCSGDEA
jgi:hypothetical protein